MAALPTPTASSSQPRAKASFNVPFARGIGANVLKLIDGIGDVFLFLAQSLKHLPRFSFYGQYIKQCASIGVGSIPIVLLTAFFTGGVLALQGYTAFSSNSGMASTQLPRLVVISMVRELGPVLAALMLASRAGAAMSAELASMRVTEQIDALVTLATNPFRYLVMPRILACVTMLPLLVILANIMGIFGGYMVATQSLGLPGGLYMSNTFSTLDTEALTMTLMKATAFGLIIGLMATYHGFNAKGGAVGVGTATTRAVVFASVAILVVDYFITALFV